MTKIWLEQNLISNSHLILYLKKFYKRIGLEAFIWISSIFYLAIINSPSTSHFTICPLANLGIEFCPGCGLGNSISYLLQGNLSASFSTHPLGIFALLIILFRIITLLKFNRRSYG